MACLGLRLKISPGEQKLAAKIDPPLNPTKNGLHARAVFMSIVEATGFTNTRHQQGLVSERKQQGSCVPNEAYS